jgi:hypothetical protein
MFQSEIGVDGQEWYLLREHSHQHKRHALQIGPFQKLIPRLQKREIGL